MIHIRPVEKADFPYIAKTQRLPEVSDFVSASSDADLEIILGDSDQTLLMAIRDGDGAPVGFAHLRGLGSPARAIELYRLAMSERSKGYGRSFLQGLMSEAFGPLNANRFWLDVFPENVRAHHVYENLGFVEEGLLRETYWWQGAFRSVIIMSILAREYRVPS